MKVETRCAVRARLPGANLPVHGSHRMYRCLRDFGVAVGPGIKELLHGFAFAGSVGTVFLAPRPGAAWS